MTAKQRILALRFLEKQKRNPSLAKKMGVEIKIKEKEMKICRTVRSTYTESNLKEVKNACAWC